MSETSQPTITRVRRAGENHQVVTVEGGKGNHRRQPCSDCPWRRDAVGVFPAEAFRHSAPTAYDMSERSFACHQSGTRRPATCAGFLLKGSEHNLTARLKRMKGEIDDDALTDGGHDLFDSYREMAEANGVPSDDPILTPCRE